MAKLSLAARAKKDPKLLARVLKNPGLRSKLPPSMLPPEMRQQRATNLRLSAPIVPGSTTTERDLAREGKAAADVRYGPVEAQQRTGLAEEQARQRDIGGPGGFYDQYLKQVAAQSANVNAIGAQAAQAGLNAQAGITGLAGADLTGIQNPANAGAAARGVAPAGDLSGTASNAAAIRQALLGSFVAQQAGQNAAASTQAGNFANVVAPTQKLAGQAMAQGQVRLARGKISDTAREKGAFGETFRAGRRTDEAKQVLARQTLGANVAKADASTKAAATKAYGSGGTGMNKYGYTYDEWKGLSDKERSKARAGKTKKAGGTTTDTVYTSGAFAGRSKSEVAGMTSAERAKIVKDYATKPATGKPKSAEQQYSDEFYGKYGVRPINTAGVNTAKGTISRAKVWLKTLKDSGVNLDAAGRLLTTGQAKTKDSPLIPQLDPVLIRVAMDQARMNGYISAQTADRLHRAGYSVPGLGLKTVSRTPAAPKPTFNPGGNVGGFPKP